MRVFRAFRFLQPRFPLLLLPRGPSQLHPLVSCLRKVGGQLSKCGIRLLLVVRLPILLTGNNFADLGSVVEVAIVVGVFNSSLPILFGQTVERAALARDGAKGHAGALVEDVPENVEDVVVRL